MKPSVEATLKEIKKLKTPLIIALLLATTGLCRAQDDVTFSSGTLDVSVPEASPAGVSYDATFTTAPGGGTVEDLTVQLNVSGGFNGNFSAYLVAPNGTQVTLLNQPGVSGSDPFGNMGSGFNITLADGNLAITDTLGTPGAVLTGTFAAVGSLSAVNGSVADGTWSLLFSDLGSGGGSPTVTGVTLNLITSVPEPANTALAIFGLMMAGGIGVRMVRAKRPAGGLK